MRRVVVSLCILLAASSADAGKKSRQTATLLSAIPASVSGAIAVSGFVFAPEGRPTNPPLLYTGIGMLFVTPSIGEFYAGQYLTWGMAVRGAAAGLAVWTLESQTKVVTCDTAHTSDEKCKGFTENAYPLLGIAAIAFVGGVWYDVLDAKDAADRYNVEHGYMVAPTVVPSATGPAPGVMLSGSF